MLVNIHDKDGLVRDMSSGAVLNTDRTEYENYMTRKKQNQQAKQQVAKQAEEINNLKNDINEIKQMLVLLMNK